MKKIKSGASLNRHNSKQNYSTPDDFMRAVVKRFGSIDFDLAAEKSNAKASHFYTKQDDALKQNWGSLSGTLWLNPPYNDIGAWARMCAHFAAYHKSRILLLTPASVDSNWFMDYVHNKALVLALNPRLSFDGKHPYPKGLMLSCFNVSQIGFDVWRWR